MRSGATARTVATIASGVLRALSICAPATLLSAPATLAQAGEPTGLVDDIPAQPLAQALAALASQTGLQLMYVSGVVRNHRSHAVAAGLSTNKALVRLLQGTGLRFEYLTPNSIRIVAIAVGPAGSNLVPGAEDETQEVIVTANLREERLQDVPITIQVLTSDTLAKLNATTFDDFVRYLPGVTAHGIGPGENNIYVRGLATGASAAFSTLRPR